MKPTDGHHATAPPDADRTAPPGPAAGSRALTDALDLSFRLLRAALVLLVAAYLLSGLFVVRQDERAFVLLLGRIAGRGEDRVREPGLHWTFPRPVAEVVRLATERVRTVSTQAGPPPVAPAATGIPVPATAWDHLLVSGDANLLGARFTLRYSVADPERFLFAFADADRLLTNELHHAVVATTSRFPVDAALRTDVEAYREAVDAALRTRLAALDPGVRIERLDIEQLVPPRQVAAAFDDVTQAEQERSSRISEARAYAARQASEASGTASRRRAEARAARDRLVAETGADAAYFEKVYPKYLEHPAVTARTLRQDALRRALGRVEGLYVLRDLPGGEAELRLWISPRRKAFLLPGEAP